MKTKMLAQQADPLNLYENSVQYVPSEIEFINQTYQSYHHHQPTQLREDFCGTALLSTEWVKKRKINTAVGIDLDNKVLEWAKKHHLADLTQHQSSRLQLLNKDVNTAQITTCDVIVAFNFSYWIFKTRKALKNYFSQAFNNLNDEGILFLDAYGGHESYQDLIEQQCIETDNGSVTYTWQQLSFNPINHDLHCQIHFEFSDGSRLEQAFDYQWRFWTLQEISELLLEAGFSQADIYWQGFDEDGEADGHFVKTTTADAEAGWICYILGIK